MPQYSITKPTSLAYVDSAICHKMNVNPSPGGIHQNSGYFRYILLYGYQFRSNVLFSILNIDAARLSRTPLFVYDHDNPPTRSNNK